MYILRIYTCLNVYIKDFTKKPPCWVKLVFRLIPLQPREVESKEAQWDWRQYIGEEDKEFVPQIFPSAI